MRLRADEKKKAEDKAEDLKRFIARFSANASKSKQTTSRAKQLEKLNLDDLPVSSRRQPFVGFDQKREAGNDILVVNGITKALDGERVLRDIRFTVNKGDKIALIGPSDIARTTLFKILTGELEADAGDFAVGATITTGYFPSDNSAYFNSGTHTLVDWLRQYSHDQDESFIRGFLGKMLFAREEANKMSNVLSGGERVRCMLAKIMLSQPNLLLLDEPTSHLDLEAVNSLNEGMQRYKGTLIFTSHDHELVQTVANRIIEIDGGVVYDKYTTYDDYIEEQAAAKGR
jgi:ATPase subunit of ABC transporter with duplicated ATPase domains